MSLGIVLGVTEVTIAGAQFSKTGGAKELLASVEGRDSVEISLWEDGDREVTHTIGLIPGCVITAIFFQGRLLWIIISADQQRTLAQTELIERSLSDESELLGQSKFASDYRIDARPDEKSGFFCLDIVPIY